MQDQKKEITKEGTRTSTLSKGRERFLAHVIEHGFEVGRRSPEDFVRHFPPTLIMEGLRDQPKLRANILVAATGVKEKVAIKKSWESCADDLQIALDEGETDATMVMKVFVMDDRVRYLDAKLLWAYVTEGEFWKISPSRQKEYAAAKSHMAFMLARALEDKLVTHADIVEGITVEELASRLPKSELGKIIKGALDCGKRNAPFTETDLLGSMPPDVLVNYMPLFQVWDSIIETKIAFEHGYAVKKKGDKVDAGDHPSATNNTLPTAGAAGGMAAAPAASGAGLAASPGASASASVSNDDDSPATSNDDDFGAFAPPTSRTQTEKVSAKDMKDAKDFKDNKDNKDKAAAKGSRPKTPPPPAPPAGVAKPVEDPSTWSQEFDEDTEFVDAADLLDEEPTINSKGGLGGKESVV
ncbi:MAG TPA: hypothetical protein VFS67_16620 [Polyangiaceae bacterium]|nr:hypothetical protein [Polyangiaceae bacterium]